jgi:hypothetical protein
LAPSVNLRLFKDLPSTKPGSRSGRQVAAGANPIADAIL